MFVVLSQVNHRAARFDDDGNALPESGIETFVNPAFIRCFYARHEGEGTRLTFMDGNGFAVIETVDKVAAAIAQASGQAAVVAASLAAPAATPAIEGPSTERSRRARRSQAATETEGTES